MLNGEAVSYLVILVVLALLLNGGPIACLAILGTLALVFIVDIRRRKRFDKRLQAARLKYEEMLERLRLDPTNLDLEQQALELGRQYSMLTRKWVNAPVYDGVDLMNDICEATMAAASPALPPDAEQGDQSVEARLIKLHELMTKGLITQRQYVKQRRQILDETIPRWGTLNRRNSR